MPDPMPPMSAAEKTAKERLLEIVRDLPDSTSFDEILRELAFLRMVDRGLTDADRGRQIVTSQLRDRIKAWQR